MPEGFGWWVAWLLISVTVFWAAVWYWLPALFRDRDREPPVGKPKEREHDAPERREPRSGTQS